MQFSILILLLSLISCYAGSKSKPHSHQGELQPYDNHHIPYSITPEQQAKLDAGDPVTFNERSGKNGRGVVIQDVAAPPAICMDRIRDLTNYNKMVPKVRSVSIYDQVKFPNGTEKVGAEFNVALSLLSFNYYLALTFEPKYYTLTWTLDYKYSSDFDDNTGHWQVMPHPTKSGWSRVLYSTEVKLYSWIPEFVVTFLTKTALVESTTWVRKESELMVKKGVQESAFPAVQLPDLRPCFITDSEGSRYETHCSEGKSSKSEL
eukprot:gene2163-2360_t